MEIIEIKKYNSDYLVVIQKLLSELMGKPVQFPESSFKEILSSENSHLFFLKDKESVIGMFTVGIYKSPTGSKAWIEDVVVDNNVRGKGLGRLIMEYAISYVKSLCVETLMLTSNPSRVIANKLYQSLGFEQKETNVYRMILKSDID